MVLPEDVPDADPVHDGDGVSVAEVVPVVVTDTLTVCDCRQTE